MNEERLREFQALPKAESCRLIDFDQARIVTLESFPPQYVLVVSGTKPYLNMEVDLVPLIYIQQPEYWGIEVVGCLPGGIGLPATAPYTAWINLSGSTGTEGIEVIGATRSEKIAVPPKEDLKLKGGVLATFDVVGERFRVWVTNRQTIRDLYALQQGQSTASIPSGRILRGPGRARHNAPYHWHLDPWDIEMAEVAIEVCDATPSYVEENVDEFVENVGRYCPWSAKLVELQDYTEGTDQR